jgi:hypothetical protein
LGPGAGIEEGAMMNRLVAGLLAVVLSSAVPASASDHLVTGDEVQSALQAASQARLRDVARLERVLSAPEAAGAAAAAGTSVAELRGALSTLGEQELRDLAARAAALSSDPVAGLDPDVKQLLVIFLIVAIVILVFQAVD